MSVSSAVHFRGRAMAITAFENREVKAWALFNNKQFMASFNGNTPGEAAAALDEYLNLMDKPENVAVYTVKVYEDLKPGEKIKSNTPDDGSFNFRFHEPDSRAVGSSNNAGNYEMLQLLQKMDKRLTALEEDPGEETADQEPPNIVGQIKGFLEIPGMQAIISGLVTKLTGVSAPAPALGYAPAATPTATTATADVTQDPQVHEYTQVIDAYNTIKNSGMPDALQMLQKLAAIGVTDQEKFRMIQGSIKMFL